MVQLASNQLSIQMVAIDQAIVVRTGSINILRTVHLGGTSVWFNQIN